MSNDYSQSLVTYSAERAWSNGFTYFILNNEKYMPFVLIAIVLFQLAYELLCGRRKRVTAEPSAVKSQLTAELGHISAAIVTLQQHKTELAKRLAALKTKRG